MEADLLSPLRYYKIGVLFSIILIVSVWWGVMVRSAAFINNDCRFECSLGGFARYGVVGWIMGHYPWV